VPKIDLGTRKILSVFYYDNNYRHDACPEDREEICRRKKCEGCPGQALRQSMSGIGSGKLILKLNYFGHVDRCTFRIRMRTTTIWVASRAKGY
jgi:hypothetical protein